MGCAIWWESNGLLIFVAITPSAARFRRECVVKRRSELSTLLASLPDEFGEGAASLPGLMAANHGCFRASVAVGRCVEGCPRRRKRVVGHSHVVGFALTREHARRPCNESSLTWRAFGSRCRSSHVVAAT